MAFKVLKETGASALKMASFRLPEPLLDEVKKIAETEGVSVTNSVRQMLQYCVDDLKNRKGK